MGLPTNLSMRDVQNEFGTSTKPANDTLQAYLTAIFNSWSVGEGLSKFIGYGRPSVSGLTAVDVEIDYITVSFDVTAVNNLECQVVIDFSKTSDFSNIEFSDFASSFDVEENNYQFTSYGERGYGFDADTAYHIRARYYNKFVQDYVDHLSTSSILVDTPVPLQTGTTSPASSVDINSFGAGVDIDALLDTYVDYKFQVWEGHSASINYTSIVADTAYTTVFSGGGKSAIISGLNEDSPYSYRALLRNSAGVNTLNTVYVTTAVGATTPPDPTIISVVHEGYDLTQDGEEYTIEFDGYQNGASYEGAWNDGSGWSTPKDLVEFTFATYTNGKLYISGFAPPSRDIRIRAYNSAGSSQWSNIVTVL